MGFLVKFHSSEHCFRQTGSYSYWLMLMLINLENLEDHLSHFLFYSKNPKLVTWSIACMYANEIAGFFVGSRLCASPGRLGMILLCGSELQGQYYGKQISLHCLFLSLSLTKVGKIEKINSIRYTCLPIEWNELVAKREFCNLISASCSYYYIHLFSPP